MKANQEFVVISLPRASSFVHMNRHSQRYGWVGKVFTGMAETQV